MYLYHIITYFLISWFFTVHALAQTPSTKISSDSSPVPDSSLTHALVERKQALAEEQDAIKRNSEVLVAEQKALEEKIASLPTTEITAKMLKEAAIEKDAVSAALENLRLAYQNTQTDIDNQLKVLKDKQSELEILRKTVVESTQLSTKEQKINTFEEELQAQQTLVELAKAHLQNTAQRIDITKKHLELVIRWHLALQEAYQARQKKDLNTRIRREQQDYLSQATQLRQALEQSLETDSPSMRYLLEVQIQDAEEQAQQIERELRITYIDKQLEQLQTLVKQGSSQISQLTLDKVKSLVSELDELQALLQGKINVLNQQEQVTKQRRETLNSAEKTLNKETEKILVELRKNLQQQADKLPLLLETGQQFLIALEGVYKKNLREILLRQRQLPKEATEWQSFARDVALLPALCWKQLLTTAQDFTQAIGQMNALGKLKFAAIVLLWFGVLVWAHSLLISLINRLNIATELTYFRRYLLTGLHLLRMNGWSILLGGLLFFSVWLIQLTSSSIYFVFILIVPWLMAKILIDFAWLILVKNTKGAIAQPQLYRLLRLNIITIGLFTVISALGHLLSTSLLMRDFIDSLFMLLLSLTVVPVMHIRNLFLRSLSTKKNYWFQVIQLTSLLIPLTILTVALLGLVGYINLGWYVAKHLTLFLLVFTGWLVIRGLLIDAVVFLKNFAMLHSFNGLLWTQDIIPLLHKLLSLALVVSAFWLLLLINGWYADVAVMSSIQQFLSAPFIHFANSSVSLGGILFSLFALWIIFWFGGWFRRITYRWLYTGIDDLGIRNSLSIFTQYVVILIGFLVVLKIIGIDLSALAVFAGALGIGIGFGLQNIANNFISGILLLIERPLRIGDIVNVGGVHEGIVTQIGIRSLTVKTWDQKDAIIPNSDLISNAFTNWTYSDKHLRITLYVGISYNDDPRLAKETIVQVLKDNRQILTEPEPSVTLWEFADSSVNFRIDYYFHLFNSSGFKTREDILLAIWDRFKTAGITIPYPQRMVHLTKPYHN